MNYCENCKYGPTRCGQYTGLTCGLDHEPICFDMKEPGKDYEKPKKLEKILCAAIHYDNGLKYKFQTSTYGVETGFVLCGYRHPFILDVLPTNPYWLKGVFAEGNAEEIQKYEELKYKYGWQEDSLTRCKTVQGFITTTGRFVNRKEAWEIARAAGQIDDNGGYNRELFSEDLY